MRDVHPRQPADPGHDRDRSAETAITEPRRTIGHLRPAMTERMLGTNVLRHASESTASVTQTPPLIVRVP